MCKLPRSGCCNRFIIPKFVFNKKTTTRITTKKRNKRFKNSLVEKKPNALRNLFGKHAPRFSYAHAHVALEDSVFRELLKERIERSANLKKEEIEE